MIETEKTLTAGRAVTIVTPSGRRMRTSKLKDFDLPAIRACFDIGMGVPEVAQRIGVSASWLRDGLSLTWGLKTSRVACLKATHPAIEHPPITQVIEGITLGDILREMSKNQKAGQVCAALGTEYHTLRKALSHLGYTLGEKVILVPANTTSLSERVRRHRLKKKGQVNGTRI